MLLIHSVVTAPRPSVGRPCYSYRSYVSHPDTAAAVAAVVRMPQMHKPKANRTLHPARPASAPQAIMLLEWASLPNHWWVCTATGYPQVALHLGLAQQQPPPSSWRSGRPLLHAQAGPLVLMDKTCMASTRVSPSALPVVVWNPPLRASGSAVQCCCANRSPCAP